MIVKIFKTIGPRTYFTSIFLIVFAVLFSFVLENKGAFLLEQWPSILGNIILIVAFIAMLTFLEIQHKGRKLGGVHLIAYPTTFLFLPTVFELKTIPVLEAILLILGQDIFIKTLHSKNKEKGMLDLSLIISIIVQLNASFAIFYLLPLLIFFNRGIKSAKDLLALLLPVFIIPFTFNGLSVILPSETVALINPPIQVNPLKYHLLSSSDWVWLIALLLSVLVCALQLPRGHKKFSYPEYFSGFLYMTFWLIFSIVFGLLGLQIGVEFWLISFIPVAYFFGGFLEKIKSDSLRNILFTSVFLWIVLFKLFDHGIMSLELLFGNGENS
jgi:hypothetical protein